MSTETEQTTELQDVFDDSASGSAASKPEYEEPENEEEEGAEGTEAATNEGAEEAEEGEEEASETPAEGQDEEEEPVVNGKGQKMIPESRLKAALKSAEARIRSEIEAEYNKPAEIPVPDKATDPQGHERRIRMDASVQVMREMRPDYQEVINHYATMAEGNDLLNQAVEADPLPAKLAYDIAKKDLEIKEALALKGSPEWKEFQEYKKNKGKTPKVEDTNPAKRTVRQLGAVPNLNRSTNASPNRNVRTRSNGENDDKLFEGAL